MINEEEERIKTNIPELKTKYETFEETYTKRNGGLFEAKQWIFKFKNGYGASVICHKKDGRIISGGTPNFPFGLAVIFFIDDAKFKFSYNDAVSEGGMFDCLDAEDVEETLERIERLNGKGELPNDGRTKAN